MSLEFDIACLRCPCNPTDYMDVVQLIARSKMAADQLEKLIKEKESLINIINMVVNNEDHMFFPTAIYSTEKKGIDLENWKEKANNLIKVNQ